MRRYSPVLVQRDVRRITGPIRTGGLARARRDELWTLLTPSHPEYQAELSVGRVCR